MEQFNGDSGITRLQILFSGMAAVRALTVSHLHFVYTLRIFSGMASVRDLTMSHLHFVYTLRMLVGTSIKQASNLGFFSKEIMLSCNGFRPHPATSCRPRPPRLQSNAKSHTKSNTSCHKVLHSPTPHYKVSQGTTKYYSVHQISVPECRVLHKVLQSIANYYTVLFCTTKCYCKVVKRTRTYDNLEQHTSTKYYNVHSVLQNITQYLYYAQQSVTRNYKVLLRTSTLYSAIQSTAQSTTNYYTVPFCTTKYYRVLQRSANDNVRQPTTKYNKVLLRTTKYFTEPLLPTKCYKVFHKVLHSLLYFGLARTTTYYDVPRPESTSWVPFVMSVGTDFSFSSGLLLELCSVWLETRKV